VSRQKEEDARIDRLDCRIATGDGPAPTGGETQHTEDELRRYSLLFKGARDIILFIRTDGRIVECNESALRAYGYDHHELLSMTIYDLRSPGTTTLVSTQMAHADEEGILFESVHRRKDGSTFPVEVSSQGATLGTERILLSIIRDITERKRVEEALRKSESMLADAQALAHMGSYEVEMPAGNVIWSAEMYRIVDRDPRLGPPNVQQYRQLVHPDDRAVLDLAHRRALDEGETYDVEYRVILLGGQQKWIQSVGRPMRS
jgi:PAS domain S-box-containing protein